jgi:cytochrome P450 family 110
MSSQLPNCITSPPWWQLLTWIADPIGCQIRYSHKYGDIFTLRLSGFGSYVVVGDPQAIQEIFSQDAKFEIGRGNYIAEPLLGSNSLTLSDGERHRRKRRLLMPPFHGERLQTYAHQIGLIAEQVASQWQVDQPFVARSAMQKISLEVILQVVFGLREGERYQQLKPCLIPNILVNDTDAEPPPNPQFWGSRPAQSPPNYSPAGIQERGLAPAALKKSACGIKEKGARICIINKHIWYDRLDQHN